jgi:murein DD-endopeptidase MepM/ murein hydrolase activator NlpD
VQRDWLARPFAPDAQQWAVPTYLYGSTANGQLRVHHGVDIPNPQGTEVLAVAPGTVIFAADDAATLVGPSLDFFGLAVILELDQRYHDQPLYVLYGHLSAFRVRVGDHVDAGQPMGEVGMTGIAMGPHLHLELRFGENSYQSTRNPELWLQMLPGHGTIAGRLVNAEGRTLPGASVLVYRADSPELWRVVPVYSDEAGIQPDDEWGENFVLADVPAGAYRVTARVDGRVVSQPLTVEAGRTTFVTLLSGLDGG